MQDGATKGSAKLGQDYVDIFSGDSDDLSLEKLNYSGIANQISGRYEISGEQDAEFSNDFVQAYKVTDLVEGDNSANLYAIAYNKDMPFRLFEVLKQSRISCDNIITPLDYGITQLGSSEEQFFVAILPKPQGKTLKTLVEEGFRFDKSHLFSEFLPPILRALNELHQAEIVHGSINHENIYIDGDKVVLGECVSELCGHSQTTFFETVDRAQCNSLGKSNGSLAADFYALGMVIFFGLSGRDFVGTSDQDIIRQKLFQGTYHFLNAAFLLNGQLGDLIRGLSADQQDVRWNASEMDNLMRGKDYSVSNLTDLSYLSRAIVFNGKEHYSRKSLAYDLSINWDQAKDFIKQDKIRKWLETNSSEEKYVEAIEFLQPSYTTTGISKKLISNEDERLIKLLITIDPEGPIRCKNHIFFKEGTGPILAHSVSKSHTETTKVLASLLFLNIFEMYEILANLYSRPTLNTGLVPLKRASEFLKKSEYGFGLERCVYDLNPTLVCQSPIVKSIFCIGLKDILEFLDSTQLEFEDLVSKKTISCFLANRILMMTEIKNNELSKFPIVQRSRAYQILGILATAQKKAKINTLSNLCTTVMDSVRDVLDTSLKSSSIKKVFFEKLGHASKTGNMMELQKIALNSRHINDDVDGYTEALRRGAEIAREIFSFNNKRSIEQEVRKKSLRMAIRFSYIVCGFIILSIVLQSL